MVLLYRTEESFVNRHSLAIPLFENVFIISKFPNLQYPSAAPDSGLPVRWQDSEKDLPPNFTFNNRSFSSHFLYLISLCNCKFLNCLIKVLVLSMALNHKNITSPQTDHT